MSQQSTHIPLIYVYLFQSAMDGKFGQSLLSVFDAFFILLLELSFFSLLDFRPPPRDFVPRCIVVAEERAKQSFTSLLVINVRPSARLSLLLAFRFW
jgi:hypothetical protein